MSAPGQKPNRLCERILTALALSAIIPLTALSAQAALGAAVTTDMSDYPADAAAEILGIGPIRFQVRHMQVLHADGTPNQDAVHAQWFAVADAQDLELSEDNAAPRQRLPRFFSFHKPSIRQSL